MYRRASYLLALVLVAGIVGACASAGGAGLSLSSTRYSGQDLAGSQYETLHSFLQAHSRIRVGQTTGATVPLSVRDQRGRGWAEAELRVDGRRIAEPIPRLRTTALEDVESLRILNPDDAATEYGGSGRSGMVLVTLKESGD